MWLLELSLAFWFSHIHTSRPPAIFEMKPFRTAKTAMTGSGVGIWKAR